MATLFDRLNRELEDFGKRAQSAFDEGRQRLELMRLRRKQDNAARDLGLLVHQRERGGEVEEGAVEKLLTRLDDLKTQIDEAEASLRRAQPDATVNEQPAPEAETGEAEVVTPEE